MARSCTVFSERSCEGRIDGFRNARGSLLSGINLALILGVITLSADDASAQVLPDRRVSRMAVHEQPGGQVSLGVDFVVGLSGDAGPLNADTDVVLEIDGVQVERVQRSVQIGARAGPSACAALCTGTCGSFNGSQSLVCVSIPGAEACECETPPLSVEFQPITLTPGDEISYILLPAPGAVPDADTSNDRGRLTYGGWNRRLLRVTVCCPVDFEHDASARGGGGLDIVVERVFDLFGIASVPVDLGGILELRVNETPRATSDAPDDLIWDLKDGFVEPSGCPAPVPPIQVDGDSVCSTCVPPCSPTCNGSTCTTAPAFVTIFQDQPLAPGDEITVILRPSPGSLPELNTEDDRVSTVVIDVLPTASSRLRLGPIVPTPAGRAFVVPVTLPAAGPATLEVLDVSGRRRLLLDLGSKTAGAHFVDVDAGTKLAAGMYVVRITQGSSSGSTRAVIVR